VYFVPVSAFISRSRCGEPYRASRLCGIASLIVPSSSKPRLSESIANSPPSTHTDSLRKLYWVLPVHLFPPPPPLVRAPSPSRRPLLFPSHSHFPSYFIQCRFPKSCRLYANSLSLSPQSGFPPSPHATSALFPLPSCPFIPIRSPSGHVLNIPSSPPHSSI
jgi:hypothetical protein